MARALVQAPDLALNKLANAMDSPPPALIPSARFEPPNTPTKACDWVPTLATKAALPCIVLELQREPGIGWGRTAQPHGFDSRNKDCCPELPRAGLALFDDWPMWRLLQNFPKRQYCQSLFPASALPLELAVAAPL